jgi:hypothetical protein
MTENPIPPGDYTVAEDDLLRKRPASERLAHILKRAAHDERNRERLAKAKLARLLARARNGGL